MKQHNCLVAVIMILRLSTFAQDSNNQWAVSLGANAIDYRSSAGGGKNWLDNHFSQLFLVNENWNVSSLTPYIKVSRYFRHNISAALGGSVNKINKYVVYDPLAIGHNSAGMVVINPGNLRFYGVDLSTSYSFMDLVQSKAIDPFLNLGAGYNFLGNQSYFTMNSGMGFNFWFAKRLALSLSGNYKWSASNLRQMSNTQPNSPSYIQWLTGITFKFGGKDTDGDGIYDKEDACPDVVGLKLFKGCPDTDGDGIVDAKDECPEQKGLAALNGCPDKDGDGVVDKNDDCPEIVGLISLKGCPDNDGDGITDKDDVCPDIAGLADLKGCPDADADGIADNVDKCINVNGPKENEGCPWPDSDEDGVFDKDDQCPEIKGSIENKGCPEISHEVIKKLESYAQTILFKPGKSTFKAPTLLVLQAIAAVLEEYPTTRFRIEGYSDTDGDDEKNLILSKERAAAVKNYLITHGIAPERLTSEGYGEMNPIDSNKTARGKANNRRVEVKLAD